MSALEQALGGSAIEVVAKATRRRFTVEYKRKIVREADGCKTPGAVGALLRREGGLSSALATTGAAGAAFARGAGGSGPRKGTRAVPHATLRGSRAGGGLRHPARRGHLSLSRAQEVSPPGRARRGAGAARSARASRLWGPGVAGPP